MRNVLPGWDVGVDVRYDDTMARDHLLPNDPQGPRPDSFYDIIGASDRCNAGISPKSCSRR
jgi:hypothetical protein